MSSSNSCWASWPDPSLPTTLSAQREEYRALLDDDRVLQAELGLERIALALVELCAGIGPTEFDERVRTFFASAVHRDRKVPYCSMRYAPMLELLTALRAVDFDVFVVSGGGTEFVRAIGRDFYGVSPDDVVGTLVSYEFIRDDAGRPHLVRGASTRQRYRQRGRGQGGQHPAASRSPPDLRSG